MELSEGSSSFLSQVASSCDLCLKPWVHAVVFPKDNSINIKNFDLELLTDDSLDIDITLQIQSRNKEGELHPENDLELEIYRSGKELNLIISKVNLEEWPILWQGSHSIWMNPANGMRCPPPIGSEPLESLGRRLRVILVS